MLTSPNPTHYQCTICGNILPVDQPLPQRCPICRSPKEAYVLIEED